MGNQKGKRKAFIRTMWMKILACIAAIAVIYALHLPAATLDEDTAATEPGLVLEMKAPQTEEQPAESKAPDSPAPVQTMPEEAEETPDPSDPASESPEQSNMAESTGSEEQSNMAESTGSEEQLGDGESSPDPPDEEDTDPGTETGEDQKLPDAEESAADPPQQSEAETEKDEDKTDPAEYTGSSADMADPGARPAQVFEQALGGLRVCVEAAEGAFPPGTEMWLALVKDEQILQTIADAVEGQVRSMAAVDITFFCGGKKIEPLQPVRVSMQSGAGQMDRADENDLGENGAQDPCIVHVTGQGEAEIIQQKPAEELAEAPAENEVVFDAETFSVYALVYTELYTTVISADGETYGITVNCTEAAQIPEGAELQVTEIDSAAPAYENYYRQTTAALEQKVSFARFFDISIVKDGKEIQPAARVEVKIALAEALDENVKAVHFGEDVDLIDVSLKAGEDGADNAVVFSAEGFSVYGVVTVDAGDLDGKTFGILNNKDTVSGTALMTGSASSGTRLTGKVMTVRTEPVERTGIVFVAQDSSISMWSFHSAGEEGQYYITAETGGTLKYLKISAAGVSLVEESQVDEDCRITVEAGSGKYSGKYRFSGSSKVLRLDSSNFTIANAGTSNDNTWMNLAELSTLTEEDFVTYTATRVSVSDTVNVPDGADVIVYTRVWNDQTLRYDYYIIDYDGMLVKAYESGDTISWVGTRINTMLWDFTEYRDEQTGEINNYYELQNLYSNKYIAPQMSGGNFLSDSPIGVNLNGRRYGRYYTSILAWDDPYYDYASLNTNEDGQLISVPMAKAADFYFAIMSEPEQTEELTRVATIDHEPFGITVKMQDYGNINQNNRSQDQVDVLGNTPYNQWTGSPGLLEKNMSGDYPKVKNSTHSLGELYDEAVTVHQQFVLNTYNESGYFEYDSTQNFAHLITSTDDYWYGRPNMTGGTYGLHDFVIYEQLGTSSEGNKDTLKHGQFLPYNDLVDEEGKPIKISQKYVNERDIKANPLSSLDPRKGEALYEIPYQKGKTSPDYVNHFFGMEMSASFMQSESGLDAWGHDLIFEFSGDDDFWLYIDGMLVLDLGGIHSALDGSINFRTGKVVVNGRNTNLRTLYKEAYLEKNPGADESTVNDWLNTIFKDDGSNTGTVFKDFSGHDMRMFYMERGAGASNIHMRFNLAPYTEGEVLLEKEVSGTDNVSYADASFPFQIWYRDPAWQEGRYALWDVPEKVTDTLTDQPVRHSSRAVIGGRSYEHVYYLTPGQTVSIKLPDESTEYHIVECGIDSHTYDAVYVNRSETPLAPTAETAPEGVICKDYRITDSTVGNRKKVIYDNHVSDQAQKSLFITKRVWSDTEKTAEWPNDTTPFCFRIYIGKNGGEYSVYSFGKYHVKGPDGCYCTFENGRFVSTGKTDLSELSTVIPEGQMKSELEKATFYTSQGGAADKIPARYVVEVPGLMDGTPFFVEEREKEIPAGYERIDYELRGGEYRVDPAIGDTHNYGVIRTDLEEPLITVNNRHGYGLVVNKVWTDAAFMESHDPIYFAVYRNENGTLTLLPDSVRQMTSPSVTYTWSFSDLEGCTLNDYQVYEVSLTVPEGGELTIDPVTGAVGGCSDITRIEENGTLTVGGTTNEHGYSADYVYTAAYEREELTPEQIAAGVNSRTDTVKNSRPGIRLVKTDSGAAPLAGGRFTLKESAQEAGNSGETLLSKTFVSDEEGLIAVAYLTPDKDYLLTETGAPEHYRILAEAITIRVHVNADGTYSLLVNGSEANDAEDRYTVRQVPEPTAADMPTVTIKNKPFTLQAVKQDADTGLPLEGVSFALYAQRTDYYSGEPIPDYFPMAGFEELITDEEGVIPKIDTEHLLSGTYYLREEVTPAGYKPLGGDIRFQITAAGEVIILNAPEGAALAERDDTDPDVSRYTLTVKNTPKKAGQVLKKSSAGNKLLPGVSFALYTMGQIEGGQPMEGEEPLVTGTTDESGIMNLGILDDNITYYLFETSTVPGYVLPDAPVVINSTARQVSATLHNAPLEVKNVGTNDRQIWQITIYNNTAYELPSTGGFGTTTMTLAGLLLTTGAALGLGKRLVRKKKI